MKQRYSKVPKTLFLTPHLWSFSFRRRIKRKFLELFNNRFLIVLLVFVGIHFQARGSHLLGCNLGWQYLGNDTFYVTATVYRDCNGVPMPAQSVIIFSDNAAPDTINMAKSGGMNVTPVCKNSCSRCGNSSCSFGLGIEEYEFSAKINFKAIDPSSCVFRIVWEACCYGNVITTGQAGEGYFVDAHLDICKAPHDNSPVFGNQPTMIFAVNQCLTYNYAGSDPDTNAIGRHDSLVYLLDTALQTPGMPASYSAGYSFFAPLKYFGSSPSDPFDPNCKGFHLDPVSGDLQFKPTKEDIAIMNILVQEWGWDANGKPFLKGDIHRNVCLFAMDFPNNAPVLSGINGTGSYDETFCVGQLQCFTINSFDADATDSVSLTKLIPVGLKNATISIETGVQHPKTTFCWNPDSASAGKTFQFVLNASDNACPLNGRISRSYNIHVNATPKVKAAATDLGCGNYQLKAIPLNNSMVSSYHWSGSDGLSFDGIICNHHYKNAGTYHWKLTYQNASGCGDTISGNVTVSGYVNINAHPHDTLICLNKNADIKIQANVTGGAIPYRYYWYGNKTKLPDTTATITKHITKDTLFMAFVQDNAGCVNWDSVKIKASVGGTNVKLIPPKDTIGCNNESISLLASATGGDPNHYTYLWDVSGVNINPYLIKATHTQNIRLYMTDGCSADSATVHLGVLPSLKVSLKTDTTICAGQKVTLRAYGSGGLPAHYMYTWDHGLASTPIAIVSPTATTTYSVKLTDGCSMADGTSEIINVNPLPKVDFSASAAEVKNGQNISFSNNSSGATGYTWYFGDTMAGTKKPYTTKETNTDHKYSDTGYFDVKLVATTAIGCTDSLIRKKYIHILPGYQIFIPNAFSPNLDSLNECFYPKGTDIKNYTLEVFTRWGNVLYHGQGCWDGNFKNDIAPEGMYIYHLNVTGNDGSSHSYAGPFYLVR